MKRVRLSVLIYLTLVFLSGVLVGVLAHRFYVVQAVTAKSARPSPEEMRRQYVDELRTRLKLRPEQLTQLQQILDATGQRYRELRKKWDPEVRSIHREQADSIRAMLDVPQRDEYEKMRQERDQRRHRGGPGSKSGSKSRPAPGPQP